MFVALHRHTTAFLRHAGLLAGFFAVVAGILGMHVISGSHDMAASAHPAHATASPTHSAAAMTPFLQSHSCAEPIGCPAMSGMDPGCTPYPGKSTLTAPPPGRTVLWIDDERRRDPRRASYPYLPGTPSPGQLCISRT